MPSEPFKNMAIKCHPLSLFMYFVFGTALLMIWACPNDDPDPAPDTIDFGCFKLKDENSQAVGIYGTCTGDPDWTNFQLQPNELKFLNFDDTVNINTNVAKTIVRVDAYPNPIPSIGRFQFFFAADDDVPADVKVKMVAVDSLNQVLSSFVTRAPMRQSGGFAVNLTTTIENGRPFRLYYKIESGNGAILYQGYGDMLYCRTSSVTDIPSQCF